MEYKENHYYQNKENGKVVRLISEKTIYDLSTKKEELIKRDNQLMKLGITICRISELKEENNRGKNIFKTFIEDINLSKTYKLNLINTKYYLQVLNTKDKDVRDEEFVKDDINDFFTKIEFLKGNEFKLTIEQKDNLLIEQFK